METQSYKQVQDVFQMAEQYERDNPGIAEAMRVLGISLERYEASLIALYNPQCVTVTSTEELYAYLG